jgi:alanine-glyoxylate transaminase/serine-glyoxylate transaminase/serine-pyruvate transaminase
LLCRSAAHRSPTLTAVTMPDGVDSDEVIRHARQRFGLSLGVGLGRLKGKALRIGHLGALNELEVLGTLGGLELALRECGVPLDLGAGVAACQRAFAQQPAPRQAEPGQPGQSEQPATAPRPAAALAR